MSARSSVREFALGNVLFYMCQQYVGVEGG